MRQMYVVPEYLPEVSEKNHERPYQNRRQHNWNKKRFPAENKEQYYHYTKLISILMAEFLLFTMYLQKG
jgi:hypothetical protein